MKAMLRTDNRINKIGAIFMVGIMGSKKELSLLGEMYDKAEGIFVRQHLNCAINALYNGGRIEVRKTYFEIESNLLDLRKR